MRGNCSSIAGVIQLVECQLPKLDVAGSSPVARSVLFSLCVHDLCPRPLEGAVFFHGPVHGPVHRSVHQPACSRACA